MLVPIEPIKGSIDLAVAINLRERVSKHNYEDGILILKCGWVECRTLDRIFGTISFDLDGAAVDKSNDYDEGENWLIPVFEVREMTDLYFRTYAETEGKVIPIAIGETESWPLLIVIADYIEELTENLNAFKRRHD
jgi:hypothetical protein